MMNAEMAREMIRSRTQTESSGKARPRKLAGNVSGVSVPSAAAGIAWGMSDSISISELYRLRLRREGCLPAAQGNPSPHEVQYSEITKFTRSHVEARVDVSCSLLDHNDAFGALGHFLAK